MAFVYIIQSQKNHSYYVGSSGDYKRRLSQHNTGNVEATKYKKPYKLVFVQEFKDLSMARCVEMKIKKWKRKDYIEKIVRDGKIKFVDG